MTEPHGPIDDILGRLHHTSEAGAEDLTPPRSAKPVGWVLVLVILGIVVYAAITASPL